MLCTCMAAPTSALVNDKEGGLAMAFETDRVEDSNDDCSDKNDGKDDGMWGGGKGVGVGETEVGSMRGL